MNVGAAANFRDAKPAGSNFFVDRTPGQVAVPRLEIREKSSKDRLFSRPGTKSIALISLDIHRSPPFLNMDS